MSLELQVKYFNDVERLDVKEIGNYVDCRCASHNPIVLRKGDFALIPLGFAINMPDGYIGKLLPRSSTYKNFGIIMTNSEGIIDTTYRGDGDQWMFPALAMRDTIIHFNDRIAQMCIEEEPPKLLFKEVEYFGNPDRGGIGSTGIK